MANLSRFDPFEDLFDDFFKGFFVRPVGFERASEDSMRQIRVDVIEEGEAFKVLAELPGVKKDDIKVKVDGDQVSIAAENRLELDAKDRERVLRNERYYGKLGRTLRFGQDIDESRASARYSDGVLELTLPKRATTGAKQLAVQ